MGRVVIVAGTDMEVGKTFVSAALARRLVQQGFSTLAVTPIECGVSGEVSDDEDGAILASATSQASPKEALQRLKAPLAPPDAADLERVVLEAGRWIGAIRGWQRVHDVVLVEGVGGLMSPQTWTDSALTMAQRLDAKVLLVASDRLGTLNHTLLCLHALKTHDVPIVGVVFSAPADSDRSTGRNASALARLSGIRRIVSVPGMDTWQSAAPIMDAVIPWVLDP